MDEITRKQFEQMALFDFAKSIVTYHIDMLECETLEPQVVDVLVNDTMIALKKYIEANLFKGITLDFK